MDFEYTDLSPDAKVAELNTLQRCFEFEPDFVIENATTILRMLGFSDTEIEYSGFYSQGDGASFIGTGSYVKGMTAAVRAYAPRDTELHRIARELTQWHRRRFYAAEITVARRTSRYYHDESTVYVDDEKDATEIVRDLCQWIYKQLCSEYDYQSSEDVLTEGRTFEEDGYDLEEVLNTADALVQQDDALYAMLGETKVLLARISGTTLRVRDDWPYTVAPTTGAAAKLSLLALQLRLGQEYDNLHSTHHAPTEAATDSCL